MEELNFSKTFLESQKRSDKLVHEIDTTPEKFRVLTGDRPTGSLHLGHYFGSLKNRVLLQQKGMELFVVIADYQVLTDHTEFDKIAQNTRELVLDYLSVGLNPESGRTFIFPHSHVPELNQLLVPFLTLVSNAELERNPTVKEEIQASGLSAVNAGMFVYPVHQAADILSVGGNVVPVGKDQLPHVEMTRTIARRFNKKFSPQTPVFEEPVALLSQTVSLMGLDGVQKMSKSRNNAIMLKATRDEIVQKVKKATTDCERMITYEPQRRPQVANLLRLISVMDGRPADKIASLIGDAGAKALKEMLIETACDFLRPIQEKRKMYEQDPAYVCSVLRRGVDRARQKASETLSKTLRAMNMESF
jgi:tryptophanyl-tRNA synthetase